MITLLKINNDIKDAEQFIKNYLDDNNLTENDIYYKVEEEEKKLLKSKKYAVSIVLKKDIIEYVKEYLENLSSAMKFKIQNEVNFKEDVLNIMITSDNNCLLIGKDGKNLNALQYLIKQAITNNTGFNIKIYMDISNYKSKKINNLEYQINKIAREVLRTKVEAKLDPMNSYERRIVHNIINKYEDLETESFGEEPERYVVIRNK